MFSIAYDLKLWKTKILDFEEADLRGFLAVIRNPLLKNVRGVDVRPEISSLLETLYFRYNNAAYGKESKVDQTIKDCHKELKAAIKKLEADEEKSQLKADLRKLEGDNELDKKRIVERFEKEIASLTDYFKKTVQDVRKDFTDDIRSMQKLRARDKSDADVKF